MQYFQRHPRRLYLRHLKGLACADFGTAQEDWPLLGLTADSLTYGWSCRPWPTCPGIQIPMVWDHRDMHMDWLYEYVPRDFAGWLMVFNEGDWVDTVHDPPYSAGIPVEEAIDATEQIAKDFPDARLIVGNMSMADLGPGWPEEYTGLYLGRYLSGLKRKGVSSHVRAIGVHLYDDGIEVNPAWAVSRVTRTLREVKLDRLIDRLWFTEVGSRPSNSGVRWSNWLYQFNQLKQVRVVMPFTNRSDKPHAMIEADGTLNKFGRRYRDWNPTR